MLGKLRLKSQIPTLFSRKGMEWLDLPNDTLLKSLLALLEALNGQISVMDAKIASLAFNDERMNPLMTLPGLESFAAYYLLLKS